VAYVNVAVQPVALPRLINQPKSQANLSYKSMLVSALNVVAV
jgi:hypothetical protein